MFRQSNSAIFVAAFDRRTPAQDHSKDYLLPFRIRLDSPFKIFACDDPRVLPSKKFVGIVVVLFSLPSLLLPALQSASSINNSRVELPSLSPLIIPVHHISRFLIASLEFSFVLILNLFDSLLNVSLPGERDLSAIQKHSSDHMMCHAQRV